MNPLIKQAREGRKYANGMTRLEILYASGMTNAQKGELLGISDKGVVLAKRKLGITKPRRRIDSALKGISKEFKIPFDKLIKKLDCPRCGRDTQNASDGRTIYCANILPDGKCMYHYSDEDIKKLIERTKAKAAKKREGTIIG